MQLKSETLMSVIAEFIEGNQISFSIWNDRAIISTQRLAIASAIEQRLSDAGMSGTWHILIKGEVYNVYTHPFAPEAEYKPKRKPRRNQRRGR